MRLTQPETIMDRDCIKNPELALLRAETVQMLTEAETPDDLRRAHWHLERLIEGLSVGVGRGVGS